MSNGFLLASASLKGQYGSAGAERQLLSAAARYYVPQTSRATFFVSVSGEPGFWLSGAEHFLYTAPTREILDERIRLARNTLVWRHGSLTLRLEGGFGEERALEVARTLR